MQRVKLYTREGGFVVAGWIPPFQAGLEADVLIWDSRTFGIRRRPLMADRGEHEQTIRSHVVKDGEGAIPYDELLAVALVVPDVEART